MHRPTKLLNFHENYLLFHPILPECYWSISMGVRQSDGGWINFNREFESLGMHSFDVFRIRVYDTGGGALCFSHLHILLCGLNHSRVYSD